jgi:2-dehydropantoate 2-reductase
MRYVIYGAGAVGGTIGGRLHQAGNDVVLIARGAHLAAIQRDGLRLLSPSSSDRLPIPAIDHPGKLDLTDGDVVILAMKTQDTANALAALGPRPDGVAIVCAQNGVENERLALRMSPNVYGMCVMLPATHLEPGEVLVHSAAAPGILDLGRYPAGSDQRAADIAGALEGAGFSSNAVTDVMRWKRAKLLMNLGNAIEAACGLEGRGGPIYQRARDEALACFDAAGLEVASEEEDRARRADLVQLRPIDGRRREGGSSWQSLARGTGSIETDHLNGEIVLLGRLHGVPTPVNAAIQKVAAKMAAEHAPPGSMTPDELAAAIES